MAVTKKYYEEKYRERFTTEYSEFVSRHLHTKEQVDEFVRLSGEERVTFIDMMGYLEALRSGDTLMIRSHLDEISNFEKLYKNLPKPLKKVVNQYVRTAFNLSSPLPLFSEQMKVRMNALEAGVKNVYGSMEKTAHSIDKLMKRGYIKASEGASEYVKGVMERLYGTDDPIEVYRKMGDGAPKTYPQQLILQYSGGHDVATKIPIIGWAFDRYTNPIMLLIGIRLARAKKFMKEGSFIEAQKELSTLFYELARFSNYSFYEKGHKASVDAVVGPNGIEATLCDAYLMGGAELARGGMGFDVMRASPFAFLGWGPVSVFTQYNFLSDSTGFGLGLLGIRYNISEATWEVGYLKISDSQIDSFLPPWIIGVLYGINAVKAAGYAWGMSSMSPDSYDLIQGLSVFLRDDPFLQILRGGVEVVDYFMPEIKKERLNDAKAIVYLKRADMLFMSGHTTEAINLVDVVMSAKGVGKGIKTVANERLQLYKKYHWGGGSKSKRMVNSAITKCAHYHKLYTEKGYLTKEQYKDFLANYYILLSSMSVYERGGMAINHDLPVSNRDDLARLMMALSKGAYLVNKYTETPDSETIFLLSLVSERASALNINSFRLRLITMIDTGLIKIGKRENKIMVVDEALYIFLSDDYDSYSEKRASINGLNVGLMEVRHHVGKASIQILTELSKPTATSRFARSVWYGTNLQSPAEWAPITYYALTYSLYASNAGLEVNDERLTEITEYMASNVPDIDKRIMSEIDNTKDALRDVNKEIDSVNSDLEEAEEINIKDASPDLKKDVERYKELVKKARETDNPAELEAIYGELLYLESKWSSMERYKEECLDQEDEAISAFTDALEDTAHTVLNKTRMISYKKMLERMYYTSTLMINSIINKYWAKIRRKKPVKRYPTVPITGPFTFH
ncbi:MAG: hypothetical protein ACTSVF_05990 [Candidatus Asgardarchaeia archaeon]